MELPGTEIDIKVGSHSGLTSVLCMCYVRYKGEESQSYRSSFEPVYPIRKIGSAMLFVKQSLQTDLGVREDKNRETWERFSEPMRCSCVRPPDMLRCTWIGTRS